MSARTKRNLEWLVAVPDGWRHLFLSLLDALPDDLDIRWVDDSWDRLSVEGDGLDDHREIVRKIVDRSRLTCVVCGADAPRAKWPGNKPLCPEHQRQSPDDNAGKAGRLRAVGEGAVRLMYEVGEGARDQQDQPEEELQHLPASPPRVGWRGNLTPELRKAAYHEPSLRILDVSTVPARDDERVRSWVKLLDRPLALRGAPAMAETLDGRTILSSQLAMRAPWMAEVADIVERQLRLQLAIGKPWLRLDPILLVGPPGAGKSHWARLLAKLASSAFAAIDLGGASDAKGLEGTSRAWSNATPSWPVSVMATSGCANPVLVVDEIDKAASTDRHGRAQDALLAMLEPATARIYPDTCLQSSVDISQCSWVLTANDLDGLSRALLSRVQVVGVTGPGSECAEALVNLVAGELALTWDLPIGLMPALPTSVLSTVRDALQAHRSVRVARRILTLAYGIMIQAASERRRS